MRVPTALIDYGMGNLHSVGKALEQVGAAVELLDSPRDMERYRAVVLPGVGNFGDGVAQLTRRGFLPVLREWIEADRAFLGICLGMQLLLETSAEAPGVRGLGVCKGRVARFAPSDARLKVPQIGWNQVFTRNGCPVFLGIPDGSHFYFVHSYYAAPEDASMIGGETDYGLRYCSVLWKGRMVATQFHPEKSQAVGLQLLRNFMATVPA